jgi:hypothetical protein
MSKTKDGKESKLTEAIAGVSMFATAVITAATLE